jgi:hypothetical protein
MGAKSARVCGKVSLDVSWAKLGQGMEAGSLGKWMRAK